MSRVFLELQRPLVFSSGTILGHLEKPKKSEVRPKREHVVIVWNSALKFQQVIIIKTVQRAAVRWTQASAKHQTCWRDAKLTTAANIGSPVGTSFLAFFHKIHTDTVDLDRSK